MEPSTSLRTNGRFVIPHVVASHFHIRSGDVVADFGAGVGYFIETLASLVGPQGRVYACDIQKDFVDKIGSSARSKGLSQVQPLWADVEALGGSKIPDEVLDVVIMVNTYFQFEDRQTALMEVKRTLRVGGKFFLIDWSESFGGLGPQPQQVVAEDQAVAEGETAGFMFERSFDAGDHHYGLAFRRV